MDFTVYSEEANKAVRLLQAYCVSAKAEYVVLCHRSGSVLADAGSLAGDASPLALLSTSALDSANQFGAMMGNGKFSAISFVSNSKSVYVTPIDPALIVIQIFAGHLPPRVEDFTRVLVDKLNTATPAFMQEANSMNG